MADETSTPQASPAAKAKKDSGGERRIVRLLTAGAGDTFQIAEFELTHEGVEMSAEQAAELLDIAIENGVQVSVEPVQEGE